MPSPSGGTLIPGRVLDSPLMKKGGYEMFEAFPDKGTFARMRAEALKLLPEAFESSRATFKADGTPAHRQLRATSVGAQRAFYHDRRTLRFIREVTGLPVVPTGPRGGYLYYTRRGDGIGIHRDGEGCDLVLITCLVDESSRSGAGGVSCLYPTRLLESTEAIRAKPRQGAVRLRLLPGQTMLLWGGFVAHAVSPVSSGQRRIVSSLCYRLDLRDRKPPARRLGVA